MRILKVAEDIVPLTAFKAKAAEWFRRVADDEGPVVVTQNGKAAGVLLSPRAYDELLASARFVGAVVEGLSDDEAGRVISHRELKVRLSKRSKKASR